MAALEHTLLASTQLLVSAGILVGAAVAGWVLHVVVWRLLGRVARRPDAVLERSLLERCRRPTRLMVPLFFVFVALPAAVAPERLDAARHAAAVLFVVCFAWLAVRLFDVLEDVVLSHQPMGVRDNLHARKIHTQFTLLRKVVFFVVTVLALGIVLMSFERLRQLGTGLLASAGVAGVVFGLAAQRPLSNLLAGLQIAITQPIRIEDVVIVEGEWGWIEEFTLTYVVVRIWDLRRMVLPISYFIEKPFQNWTRISADLLGSVYVYVDYTVPVAEVREELQRILERSQYWDRKVWRLHVTNATDKTVELRALMSAPDSSTAWELRCEVRERLLEYLQRAHPQGLPRVRAALEPDPAAARRDPGRLREESGTLPARGRR